jgi:hypothetical protein
LNLIARERIQGGQRGACAVGRFPARRSVYDRSAERARGLCLQINRFTGKVRQFNTYAKSLAQGQVRVVAARDAAVEKPRDPSIADFQNFAMEHTAETPAGARRRQSSLI